jgi:Rieske Fe-S protein
MPATHCALAAGAITERHAEILGALYASPRKPVADAFPEAEDMLVGYALEMCFDDFVAAVRYWETVVDADGAEDQGRSDFESRHLHVSETWRGNWALDGQLDPLNGEEFTVELGRIERDMFQQDWAAAKETWGDNTCLDNLDRTPTQRRADALVEMARRSAAMPAEGQKPRPLLVIHLGDESLKRMCELASGTVIAPGQIVPHLGEAEIVRIIHAGRSRRITDLGATTRFFSGPTRDAILLRDRRCQHPGCRVPAQDCDADHIIARSRDGLTTPDNGEARCPHHNRWKADRTPEATSGPPRVPV